MHALKKSYITSGQYLAAELTSPVRHEYRDGEVFAMTGASLRHNTIAGNVFSLLRAHLKGSPCRVFMEGVKLRIARDNAFYYPDVMVAYSSAVQRLGTEDYVVDEPLLVVEVLSANTEAIDRREKRLSYRKLPTLREYLLVAQERAELLLYRRTSELTWDEINYDPDNPVLLEGLNLTLDYPGVYEGVPF
ncbi:MAG: Uma2 family endonuclease [Gammaproteobacteria bacterium]|nr:Uma2 family endonuclease [Gammaproteobacteria bacterium]MBU1653544.1 Uma2 family endonuclease [Gammaproteobacteria bacterium]MBU1961886.1 Uma2 family endonuclease [Gammaproteobacteria bacterium]